MEWQYHSPKPLPLSWQGGVSKALLAKHVYLGPQDQQVVWGPSLAAKLKGSSSASTTSIPKRFPINSLHKGFDWKKKGLFGFITFKATIHEKKQEIMKSDRLGLFLYASKYCALRFFHKSIKSLGLVVVRNALLGMPMQKLSWKFEI